MCEHAQVMVRWGVLTVGVQDLCLMMNSSVLSSTSSYGTVTPSTTRADHTGARHWTRWVELGVKAHDLIVAVRSTRRFSVVI